MPHQQRRLKPKDTIKKLEQVAERRFQTGLWLIDLEDDYTGVEQLAYLEVSMSFAQITRNSNPRYAEMEKKLVYEWQHPQTEGTEPIIILKPERQSPPAHVYVIWKEWSDMSMRDRSKLILNAYEKVAGRNSALNVTVAMGLTPGEAQRMGIEYAPLDIAT